MATTRDYKAPAIMALNAETAIPQTPIAGVAYRKDDTPDSVIEDGFRYNTIIPSASLENQFQFLLSQITKTIEQQGILGWCDLVDYPLHARVVGSNGIIYRATGASGPNNGGALDPISDVTKWQEERPQLAVGEPLFITTDQTPNELGYVGAWAEQDPDISLITKSSGDAAIGTVTGSNNQAVPLLNHTHTANLSSLQAASAGDHSHTLTAYSSTGANTGNLGGTGASGATSTPTGTAGSHTHTITGNITIDSSGESSPTMNVLGRGLVGVLWLRTA